MDTKNFGNMEKDSLELVLNEFTEQQKKMVNQVSDLKTQIILLKEKTEGFEKKLDNLKVTSPPLDTTAVQNILSQGLSEVKKTITEQPKNILQHKRFLLFPEHNAREYYSVVLRWILYIIIATYCYLLLNHLGKSLG